MEQPVSYYAEHYFHMPEFLWFLLLALGGLLLVIGIIWIHTCIAVKMTIEQEGCRTAEDEESECRKSRGTTDDDGPGVGSSPEAAYDEPKTVSSGADGLLSAALKKQRIRLARKTKFENNVECLFELIFCGGAILGFMATYYLINRFCYMEPFRSFWDRYNDYLLLALIILFILVNRLIDNVLIRLRISHDDKTAVRLLSMVYMLIIFFYIKFIYENNNYDMFITYFLTLMIGRFVYFDVSFGEFKLSVKSAFQKLPVMILALAYLALMSWVGFSSRYLIKHIGVITNVFFIHLFTIIAIAVVFYVYRILRR